MPVILTPLTSKVKLQFETGVDGEGNPVYRNKTISNVKTTAIDQDVFDTANTLGELCADPINAVNRINDSDLSEDI